MCDWRNRNLGVIAGEVCFGTLPSRSQWPIRRAFRPGAMGRYCPAVPAGICDKLPFASRPSVQTLALRSRKFGFWPISLKSPRTMVVGLVSPSGHDAQR
jgi:hypothetical protein